MVDRAKFDQHLVNQAAAAGAECRLDQTMTGIDADGTVRLGSGEIVEARIVIGADGPRSRIGQAIGAVNAALVAARQVTVPLHVPHLATDIFLSADYCGGYAWLFPRGKVANLGLGVEPAAIEQLKPLLQRLHRSLVAEGRVGSEIVSSTGGAIPVGGMVMPHGMLDQRLVLLCGDAAGLTNPITGAGINAAVLSGTLAGESAVNWLAGNAAAAEDYREELEDLFTVTLARAVRRRQAILSRYKDGANPSRRDLRAAWIAYPEYWAA
jgi:flavin-dependent dehydrogenase